MAQGKQARPVHDRDRRAQGIEYPCLTNRETDLRIAAALSLIMLSLASCAHQPRAVTRMDATYLSATPHLRPVSLESAGAFTSSRQMPLCSHVRVTIEGNHSTPA